MIRYLYWHIFAVTTRCMARTHCKRRYTKFSFCQLVCCLIQQSSVRRYFREPFKVSHQTHDLLSLFIVEGDANRTYSHADDEEDENEQLDDLVNGAATLARLQLIVAVVIRAHRLAGSVKCRARRWGCQERLVTSAVR